MAGIGLDTTNPKAAIADIKLGVHWRGMKVRAVFYYTDGDWAWPADDIAEVEKMGVAAASISVAGAKARIYDVETGDWDPGAAAAQMAADARDGEWPVCYVNRSNKTPMINNLAAEGMGPGLPAGRGFGLWVATLDGTFNDENGNDMRAQPGVVGVQYAQSNSQIHTEGTPPDLDLTSITAAGEQWLGIAAPVDTALGRIDNAITELQDIRRILKTQGA